MTAPRLDSHGDYAVLQCPRGCSYGGNLHHTRVEVFERHEDANHVNRTTVQGKLTQVDYVPNATSGNPSSRRDGLRIHFYCELCGDGLILNVGQHKGATLVDWTIDPPSENWP